MNDIENIPAVLDDVIEVPKDWRDEISFVAFDRDGLCAKLLFEKNGYGYKKAVLELDIPGQGSFRYEENSCQKNSNFSDVDDVCAGLRLNMFCQKAMQRWKIFLRGTFTDVSAARQPLHAKVSLYWTCLFDPYDHFCTPAYWITAKNLSSLSWRDIFSDGLHMDQIFYEQLGELRGRIELENHEKFNIRLKCVRERRFTEHNSFKFEKVYSEHVIVEETGFTLSNTFIKLPNHRIRSFGYASFPAGYTVPILSHIHDLEDRANIKALLSSQHCLRAFETHCIVNNFQKPCFSNKTKSHIFITGTVDARHGFGIQQEFNIISEDEQFPDQLNSDETLNETDSNSFRNDIKVFSLIDEFCMQRKLVGGKASNLSRLKRSNSFNVPHGFCITTNAFREHIILNSELKERIDGITRCMRNSEITNLQQTCSDAVECFNETLLHVNLVKKIKDMLNVTYGEHGWQGRKFAVRSSGECEDGSQLSAAGQMETFLSVQGFGDMIKAIINCWSSAFSYRVVEYRRQNGQHLIESLGVLVQEMVDAETAGVLFTNDPLTGNESVMVVNATYGLGETVVSGKGNVDTVVVKRKHADVIGIEKQEIGKKNTKFISECDSGLKIKTVLDIDRSRLCLTKEEIEHICKVGIEIENACGSAQDIEWAISESRLYILQTRPITTFGTETDDDIMHEFDLPVVNNNLLFTTANVQEVLPGALTPLTADIMLSAGSTATRRSNDSRLPFRSPVHAVRHILPFSGVALMCETCIGMNVTLLLGDDAKSDIEMNIIGQIVEEHKLSTIKDFYGRPYPSTLQKLFLFLNSLLIANRRDAKLFDILKKKADTFSVGDGAAGAEMLYRDIDGKISFCGDMLHVLYYTTSVSGVWAQIILGMLKRSSSDSNTESDVMMDMALILSECNDVHSAEVPTALTRLAKLIAESDLKQTFLEMPDQNCDGFLRGCDKTAIKSKYLQFLTCYGHRCIREGEFYAKSWNQDPVPLMKTLKLIVKRDNFQERTQHKTINDIVDSLKTPLSYAKKTLLKLFLIRKARDGVCQREFGKAILIKVCDKFKQAYWNLASQLVREGRLPGERLLFFLTHHEIGRLIETRSVRLIKLAKHRFKMWPQMNRIRYPKVNIGLPVPAKEIEVKSFGPAFTLKGMPVCLGKADGKARVLKYVENAAEIREGEILICTFTDIGWSPYFCLISGLVTELGGLISHGAVIARECGIPCVVNVSNATDLIQTGDHVLLDGGAGTISKLDL